MSFGSAIFMLYLVIMLSRGWVASNAAVVKRCAFCSSSHNGWCQLKSPSHMYCSLSPSTCSHTLPLMYSFTTSKLPLCSQSLYMLIIWIILKSLQSQIPVTFGNGRGISVQSFEVKFQFTKMMEWVALGSAKCCLGYTTVQCRLDLVLLRKSICGS